MKIILTCLACAVPIAGAEGVAATPQADPTELSLEDLGRIQIESVSAASKFDQKANRAPASVTVVGSEEIRRYGHRTFADVLRGVRGLYVNDDRNYVYLGMRGFLRPGDYTGRILILINGHRVNENLFGSGMLGQDLMADVDLIDRVEIIRGPSSSIYGSSAFFGVINVVTKDGAKFNGGEMTGEVASYDTYKGRFSYGRKLENDLQFLLSGSWFNSAGDQSLYYPEFDDPATNNGLAIDSDEELLHNVYGSLEYHGLRFQGAYYFRDKTIPTASFSTIFNDGQERTEDRQSFADLTYSTEFEGGLELTGRAYFDEYFYNGYYPYLDPFATRIMSRERALGRWAGTEINVKQPLFERVTLLAGGEYRLHFEQQLDVYDEDPPATILNLRTSSFDYGLFGQADVEILKNLTVSAGLRHDGYDNRWSTLNPRLALIYEPLPETTLKLLYGQAFRAPNLYESQYQTPTQIANPDLQPETITTYEVVVEQRLGAHHRFTASGYHYQVRDLVGQIEVTPGISQFSNLDQLEAWGGEVELEGKYANGIIGRASYALQHTENTGTGMGIENSPLQLFKAALSVPLYKDKLYSSWEIQYASGVRTLGGNHTGDFTLVNWNFFSRELIRGVEASAGVYNLFDIRYKTPGDEGHLQDQLSQNGRSYRVKVTYSF